MPKFTCVNIEIDEGDISVEEYVGAAYNETGDDDDALMETVAEYVTLESMIKAAYTDINSASQFVEEVSKHVDEKDILEHFDIDALAEAAGENLSKTNDFTEDEKWLMYLNGCYQFKAPPVCTAGWNEGDWFNFVKACNRWLPEKLKRILEKQKE